MQESTVLGVYDRLSGTIRPSHLRFIAIGTILVVWGFRRLQRQSSRMPTLGTPKDTDFRAALQEGYEKV